MRGVLRGTDRLSASPTAHRIPVAARVCAQLTKQSQSLYGPRHAAYDLKKLDGKQHHSRIGHTRATSGADRIQGDE